MAVQAQAAQRAVVAARPAITRRQLKEIGEALLYLAPSLILFAAFVFVPLLRSFWLSLYYTNPIGNPTTFGGLDHYLELVQSPSFRQGLLATVLYVLYTVPPGIILSLLLAVLVNQR